MNDAERLIRFYEGTGTDHRGRTLAAIHAYDRDALERHHDFIQWLFPLPEPSPVNPHAPRLTSDAIAAFHSRPELRRALLASLDVMLDFYGLGLQRSHNATTPSTVVPPGEQLAVVRAPHWANAARNWLTPGNHNFLRLTRIMRSCSLLGLGDAARALHAALEEVYADEPRIVGERTIGFWRRAPG
ncbi:MAG TPA: opioid growth factor receptor-related protein [Gemmatimonadaceae bacterium]|nr:opioid growth factor receptor-related protein [Gemmatimonadaceae bacterium]